MVGTTLDANHHYSCDLTSATGTCVTIRYYYYVSGTNYSYINLTNGETVEDALYKMTGNGDAVTKARNTGYVLNQNDSTIKGVIENWFKTNLTNEIDNTKVNYQQYLEDTVFCNDRSLKNVDSIGSWSFDGDMTGGLKFGTWHDYSEQWYSTENIPNLICPNETDQFKVSNEKAPLKYPVGMLDYNEVILAGVAGNTIANNKIYYLYTANSYFLISPSSYISNARGYRVYSLGYIGSIEVDSSSQVRPVVSLKLGTEFLPDGDGTPTNPYIVNTGNGNSSQS